MHARGHPQRRYGHPEPKLGRSLYHGFHGHTSREGWRKRPTALIDREYLIHGIDASPRIFRIWHVREVLSTGDVKATDSIEDAHGRDDNLFVDFEWIGPRGDGVLNCLVARVLLVDGRQLI